MAVRHQNRKNLMLGNFQKYNFIKTVKMYQKKIRHQTIIFNRISKDITQVWNQRSYMNMICAYLRMHDVIQVLQLLSKWHLRFVNNVENRRMLQQLLKYDFGLIVDKSVENKLLLSMDQISQFYEDWKFVSHLASTNGSIKPVQWNQPNTIDFECLMNVEKAACIKHWISKVI